MDIHLYIYTLFIIFEMTRRGERQRHQAVSTPCKTTGSSTEADALHLASIARLRSLAVFLASIGGIYRQV